MRRLLKILLLLACWAGSPAHAAVDPAAGARLLQALSEESLQTSGGRVLLVDGDRVLDAATGEELKPPPDDRETITVNNRVRRELGAALAALRLFDPDRKVRRGAAEELAATARLEVAPLLSRALEKEPDRQIRALLVRSEEH